VHANKLHEKQEKLFCCLKTVMVTTGQSPAIDAYAFEHDHVANESPTLAECAHGKDRFRK
jgi:hypothetical protein